MKYSIKILILFILLTGCKQRGSDHFSGFGNVPKGNSYARKFKVVSYEDFTIITVTSPWQEAKTAEFRYVLANDPLLIPDSLRFESFIRTPLNKVVIMSTTFLPFLDALDCLQTIKGVSGANNFYSTYISEELGKGNIRDVGFDQMLNYELLLDIQPDVVFMFGVQPGILKHVEKLEELGISVVLVADYLEPHPLGRAEWIRFFSYFYNLEQRAETIYTEIVNNYNSIKNSAKSQLKPKVMTGLPWKDTWHIPQGNSFAAKLIEDAGGEYVWSDLKGSEAIPMDIEKVFFRAMDADIWINAGIADSKRMLLNYDSRFAMLPAYKNDNIYNNNRRIGKNGGNDYWESGPLYPDIVLADLAKIFHPLNLQDTSFYYYRKLE